MSIYDPNGDPAREPATEAFPRSDGQPDGSPSDYAGPEHARVEGEATATGAVAVPTTDTTGAPTGKLQAKIVAVLGTGVGATVVAGLLTSVFGVQIDPEVATWVVGAVLTAVSTAAGYVTKNRSSAN